MRIEVTIAKTSPLPAGAIDALAGELSRRIQHHFPDNEGNVTVRYAGANNCRLLARLKRTKNASARSYRKPGKARMTGSSTNK